MYLTILFFLVFQSEVKINSLPQGDCARIEVQYSAIELSNNQDVKIEIKVSGGSEPYYYFFFDKNNNPLTWDFKQNHCTVAKSDFPKHVKILDSSGCTKLIDFNERANP